MQRRFSQAETLSSLELMSRQYATPLPSMIDMKEESPVVKLYGALQRLIDALKIRAENQNQATKKKYQTAYQFYMVCHLLEVCLDETDRMLQPLLQNLTVIKINLCMLAIRPDFLSLYESLCGFVNCFPINASDFKVNRKFSAELNDSLNAVKKEVQVSEDWDNAFQQAFLHLSHLRKITHGEYKSLIRKYIILIAGNYVGHFSDQDKNYLKTTHSFDPSENDFDYLFSFSRETKPENLGECQQILNERDYTRILSLEADTLKNRTLERTRSRTFTDQSEIVKKEKKTLEMKKPKAKKEEVKSRGCLVM